MRFVLVHGYSGSPEDLAPLAHSLEVIHGPGCTTLVALHPQWTGGVAPPFELEAFRQTLINALKASPGPPMVLVAHSTGGSLAILSLDDCPPDLLVLMGTPPRVDGQHLARLEAHTRPGNAPPDLLELARMVQAINAAGRRGLPSLPVLLLQGDSDTLVPPTDLSHWGDSPTTRTVLVPGAGHDLCSGAALGHVLDAIQEALDPSPGPSEAEVARLRDLDEAVVAYAEAVPGGLQALARSPSVRRALHPMVGIPEGLGPLAPAPVLVNAEITTSCPHACPACARSFRLPEPRSMAFQQWVELLDRLPHASRITFVGLGEPTLHPALPRMVALATRQGRSVSLVTSGTPLSGELAQRLLKAGLGGVTFSLDAADPELASHLRPGVPFPRTLAAMTEAAGVFRRALSMTVFTAVSTENAHHLDPVADLALALDAHAWMLSDLNFRSNAHRSIAVAGGEVHRQAIRQSISRALAAGLPVLDVHGLEELGKPRRLRELLLRPADRLWTRHPVHTRCLSPWQTAAVGVDGTLTACDCQPGSVVGNIFERPLQELWNGPILRRLRQELLSGELRAACRECPRL